jgi:acyl-CoA synthetase (NDP forming)
MFVVERRVGRLVESVMRSPVTLEEIERGDRGMDQVARSMRGASIVVIADFREAKFLLTEYAAQLTEVFRRHNSHVERSAIVTSASSAVGVLQMERMIREANYPGRRAFRDAQEAATWLGEVLTPAECARLRAALHL